MTLVRVELAGFAGWLVDNGLLGEGFNINGLVDDYLKEKRKGDY